MMSANSVLSIGRKYPSRPAPSTYRHWVRVNSEENGRLVSKVELVETDVATDDRENYTYLDFTLDKILAVGATHMLKPMSLEPENVEAVVSAVESVMTPSNPAE